MLPQDRKWAIGIAAGIAVFFVFVAMTGRILFPQIDEAFTLRYGSDEIQAEFAVWILRNDSKNIPLKINAPVEESPEYLRGKAYIQREYMATSSNATLQLRTPKALVVLSEAEPRSSRLEIEILHCRVATHRPVLVVTPDSNSADSTEIHLSDLELELAARGSESLEAVWTRGLFSQGYRTRFRHDLYSFSGQDDLWKLEVFDSITGRTESFNGMALFKIRLRFVVEAGGSEIATDWMESQFFAVDLVEYSS